MSDISALTIIDTAVKVGLGALIAGIVAYLISRENRTHDVDKAKWEARKSILLETIQASQEYFSKSSRFFACIDGVSKSIEEKGRQKNDEDLQYINQACVQFSEDQHSIEFIFGLLLALNAGKSESSDFLWEHQNVIKKLRSYIGADKNEPNIPNQDMIESYRNKLSKLRTNYYVSLNTLLKLTYA
jgi:hypothetical protein